MTRLFAVLSAFAFCACAGTSKVVQDPKRENVKISSVNGAPAPEGKILCQLERPTGSNIAERVCRYVNQNDWSSARSQDMMRQLQTKEMCNDGGCQVPSSGNR
ncbi:MAG TPA: hypothetical protein VFP52_10535 [Myxococcales bacterium]|nr:hypothetical protein [Myxococcales bacterium]HET9753392.1 hypothetical protein [Myxococcales bacterium]